MHRMCGRAGSTCEEAELARCSDVLALVTTAVALDAASSVAPPTAMQAWEKKSVGLYPLATACALYVPYVTVFRSSGEGSYAFLREPKQVRGCRGETLHSFARTGTHTRGRAHTCHAHTSHLNHTHSGTHICTLAQFTPSAWLAPCPHRHHRRSRAGVRGAVTRAGLAGDDAEHLES
jgi:hypothetical protein